jgi:hypothetical protein
MPAITSALSAICGTHLGLTKLVASISVQPACLQAVRSSSIFCAVLTGCGLVLQAVARADFDQGDVVGDHGQVLIRSHLQQFGAFGHLVAGANSSSSTWPSRGALMVCSIFIASITASAWPRLTGRRPWP